MKVFATGGAGYLGSTLVPLLLDRGHEVTVLDRFFFGEEPLLPAKSRGRLTLLRDDIRWCDGKLLAGHEAVIDMAALSNDPAGALDPWKTYEINYLGRSRIARLAREAGVKRYLVTSSCSLYGFQEQILTEESTPNPLTAYARANVLVERDNLTLATPEFCPTAVRFSTLYGLSPRMRFDLAINGMVLGATTTGKIPVMRDGNQWRPFLHVHDAARSLVELLEVSTERINGQVFNIGSDDQNFQIRPLAERVAAAMTPPPALEWYGDPDSRSYRVSFAKAVRVLGYVPQIRPEEAVHEIESALSTGATAASPVTKTVEWYRHLLSDPRASESVALRGTVF